MQLVTGPLSLLAFTIWAVFSARMVRSKQQTRALEAAIKQGDADIVKIVSEVLPEGERLAVSLSKLPSENERMAMLTQFMNQRSSAQRSRFVLSLFLMLLSLLSFTFVTYMRVTPVPSSSVESVQVSANSVSASWVSSPGFGIDVKAVLNDAKGNEVKTIKLTGDSGQVDFSGLRAAQIYSLQVTARDFLGRGEPPKPVPLVTHADHTLADSDGQWYAYYTGPITDDIEATSDNGFLEFEDTWTNKGNWIFQGQVRDGQPGGPGVLYLAKGGLTFPVANFQEFANEIVLGDRIQDFTTDADRIYFPQTFPLLNDHFNKQDGGGGRYVEASYVGPFLLRLWASPSSQVHANTFNLGPFVATPHGLGKISWSLTDNSEASSVTCGYWEGNFEYGMLKGEGVIYSYRPVDESRFLVAGEFDLNGGGNRKMTYLKNGEMLRAHQAAFLESESYIRDGSGSLDSQELSDEGRQRLRGYSCP